MPYNTKPENEDDYGKDPYQVRADKASVKIRYDAQTFLQMLEEKSLVPFPLKSHTHNEKVEPNNIAERFHSIWFGCEFPPYSKSDKIFNIPEMEEWVAS